ncbi:MAG: hypothetical protein R6W99_11085 [Clostridia bacterium]
MDLTLLYDASVVVDNNVLQDLIEIGRLDLFFAIFKEIHIPRIVYDQELDVRVKAGMADLPFFYGCMDTEKSLEIFARLTNEYAYRRLSTSDRHVIAIAGAYDYYAGSNDGLIRKACCDFNIKMTGTLGILGCAYQKDIIEKSDFIACLNRLLSDETTCYIGKKIIDEFLSELDIQI